MFAIFKRRDFRLMWSAQLVSTIGSALTDLAAGILVFEHTNSALSVGLILMVTALPTLFVGLFVMRSRSLLKPLRLLVEWAVWTPPMWRGFLERPRDPALLRPDDVIAWPAEQDGRIGL